MRHGKVEKRWWNWDVYEKFIVLHTHTGKQRDYISTRERERNGERERRAHSNIVLWTERNRKNKQIHILPGAKVRRKNEREREREKISWKWGKEMEKDFLLWQIIFKTKRKQREEVNKTEKKLNERKYTYRKKRYICNKMENKKHKKIT